jgi:hypothetical protein
LDDEQHQKQSNIKIPTWKNPGGVRFRVPVITGYGLADLSLTQHIDATTVGLQKAQPNATTKASKIWH